MLRYNLRIPVQAKKAMGSLAPLRPMKSRFGLRCISDKPNEVFTKLSDDNDPQRDAFFKYSWGSWLANDRQEKEKRTTKFSIEGLTDVINDLHAQSKEKAKSEASEGNIPPPSYNPNLTVSLSHNLSALTLGSLNPNETLRVTAMASIHEGKHHRIYKVDTNADKSFILRIPYATNSEAAISYRLKSEVATMDFADLKLGLKVPKVYCFGANALNPIRQPFILEEHIEGRLLMRDWNPLEDDASDKKAHISKLNKVIDPLSQFQSKLLSVEFNQFGSLYFAKDYPDSEGPAYEGEKNESLKNRWSVGPSVERCFWRQKSALPLDKLMQFVGPWSKSKPMDIVKSLGLLEAENAKSRLALQQTDASPAPIEESILREQVRTFENLAEISSSLFNTKSHVIPNIDSLLKPRLYHPDLDPMNVLLDEKDNSAPYLLDFENTSIKPFILQNSPQFVAYDGPKIYNLEEDVEGYKDLSEAEKVQYQFMYKRTRNQHLWESALNKNFNKLISAVAPPVKLLRSPYVACVERKNDMEYLLVDESLIQLREVWEVFAKNKLVSEKKFPLEYTEEQLQKHSTDLNAFHEQLIKSPFAATQGWIPQDMFENLVKAGILIKDKNGDYTIKQ
ncbi:Aim9p [Lachancea thermotolerans CBS 6340]|uniref:Altered inheritance of mitochondria protein 9, mitochondrial n=1 Tax=Lachancea thermotolerans (strain ATCC 56472 / CBS 6340 / NRRL Y-8284) TaxID=559295 RepID=AIM9_LACTC|nr:KLTH0A05016p [Lachancea thermotolerans CBS 6340]C5DBS6.1 RecName: Full=Altered inheritance of mitochondria protein 9, mitochondrial; AltName: Full=Found in mitochondrial proteome protein 29; Flags: Precursor [Lachancea thermotolerans CBS 6340]CAR21233.1 KLTH0A05016p [Lachancea thermotolerans CBS 6340]